MPLEHKSLSLEIKRASLTANGWFTAYASTFGGEPDLVGDIIERGAFKEALKRHDIDGTMPKMYYEHNNRKIIGNWLSMDEDDNGLVVVGQIDLSTVDGKNAYERIRTKNLQPSIGYVVGEHTRRNGIRYIKTISHLEEISFTENPANTRAKVIDLKTTTPQSARDLEKLLRDVGTSKREAKRITREGWAGGSDISDLDCICEDCQMQLDDLKSQMREILFILRGKQ